MKNGAKMITSCSIRRVGLGPRCIIRFLARWPRSDKQSTLLRMRTSLLDWARGALFDFPRFDKQSALFLW